VKLVSIPYRLATNRGIKGTSNNIRWVSIPYRLATNLIPVGGLSISDIEFQSLIG